jgi:capsular polysaccharide biosynthesis protein
VVAAQDTTSASLRLEILEKESKRLNEEQSRITAQINSYRSKVDAVPVREQEMAQLNRDYSVSKDHYQSLLDKTFSAQMAADLEQKQVAEHFTVLDSAVVPEKPFKPERRLLLPIVLLSALVLSISLAYAKDLISDSPRVERDLRTLLPANVPVLAIVPRLAAKGDRRRAIRFAAVSVVLFLVGCALDVAVYLKHHPKL